MSQWLVVRNWEKWQTYRTDRGQPPWIKVYRRLLTDPDFSGLSDAEKGHLVCIWVLAAERSGRILNDPEAIKRICGLQSIPDLEKLQTLGFLEKPRRRRGAKPTPERRHDDAPEKRREDINPPNPPLSADADRGAFSSGKPEKKNGKRINLDTPEAVASAFQIHLGRPPPMGKDLAECRTLFWQKLKEARH